MNDVPHFLLDGDDVVRKIIDKANLFNNFFANLKSESLLKDDDCSLFIFNQFKDRKRLNSLNFSFFLFSESEVKKLLNNSSLTILIKIKLLIFSNLEFDSNWIKKNLVQILILLLAVCMMVLYIIEIVLINKK